MRAYRVFFRQLCAISPIYVAFGYHETSTDDSSRPQNCRVLACTLTATAGSHTPQSGRRDYLGDELEGTFALANFTSASELGGYMPASAYPQHDVSQRDVPHLEPSLEPRTRAGGTGDRDHAIDPRNRDDLRRPASVLPLIFGFLLAAALCTGWFYRDEGHLTPESGLGYWLGIIGASMMVLLLIYPLRKRLRTLRWLGSVSGWFRIHMILGLLGPTLILFHSNFKLGSLNSNVALFAMLIVACSGIIGRYLYSRVHLGLYGRKAEIRELLAEVDAMKDALGDRLPIADHLGVELDLYAARATADRAGVASWALTLLRLRLLSGQERRHLIQRADQSIAVQAQERGWSARHRREQVKEVRKILRLYFAAVARAAAFAFYERVFALWHILHLPLFFLLVLTAVAHIVAAHLY
jgi:hypothetical protein